MQEIQKILNFKIFRKTVSFVNSVQETRILNFTNSENQPKERALSNTLITYGNPI